MSYSLELLSGEPILVATGHSNFSIAEAGAMMDEAYHILDAHPEKLYYVSDLTSIHLSLDDVMQGSSLVTRGQKPVLLHPNIIENVFITSSRFMQMAAAGLSSPVFGGRHIEVTETLDDALAYCRQKQAVS